MTAKDALEHVARTRIIAILRGDLRGREVDLIHALVNGGITAIEVSTVTPGFATCIANLQKAFSGQAAIGVGTALTADHLRAAAENGASFVVSPNTNPAIIDETKKLGMASFPGAYTPTEVVLAIEHGADAVKLFPAVSIGPAYVKALLGPLPNARLIPTGGIDPTNLSEFLDAGSFAVGIGSELIGKNEIEATNLDALEAKARRYARTAQKVPNAR